MAWPDTPTPLSRRTGSTYADGSPSSTLPSSIRPSSSAHIELHARWCKSEGKSSLHDRAQVVDDLRFLQALLPRTAHERDPVAHVRRPKQDYKSSTLGLDRNELGAFPVQA